MRNVLNLSQISNLMQPAGVRGPVVITAAVTGGVHGKEANPALPEQPDEIAAEAAACQEAGAAVIHCHARDRAGASTGDAEVFAEILDRVRRESDLLVNFTTGGAPGQSMEERLEVLDVRPDLVTLNGGTMLYQVPGEPEEPFVNTRAEIELIAKRCREVWIKPELELYNSAMLLEFTNLVSKDLLEPPYLINAVLGTPMQGGDTGSVWSAVDFQMRLPADCHYSVTACARAQLPLAVLALLTGAHLRVGLEDNIYYRRGELATGNAQLVARIKRIADELGIEVATPDQAREILGLASVGRTEMEVGR